VELANRRWELGQCGLCNLAKVELANRRCELGQCGLSKYIVKMHNKKWKLKKKGDFEGFELQGIYGGEKK
jgi:hypothetical protein